VSQEFMTVNETAAVLRCHVETVRRLIGRNQLAAVKVGNRWLIDATRLPRAGYRTYLPPPPPSRELGRVTE
jgi:excisionase family DNA binding protein